MGTRVGIELSPTACRIVEVDDGPFWPRHRGETRVRSFAVLPPSGQELRARLESLRRRRAAVVVWGGRSEHRQVMVTAGSYEAMRAEAIASLTAAGLATTGVWTDIAPATPADDRAARRPVVVSMASASEMLDALQPLYEAGLRVRTVTTPAIALSSLARMRQTAGAPGAIDAYIAFDEQVTCIALVRKGVLLAARDLPWGFVDEDYTRREPRSREDMSERLADAISGFVADIGGSPADIGQVCVCGGLPDLRSMAASLMTRLDLEVEPLDSLFGIDAARLPAPADEFRERGAELRLAWAAAADWPPTINLLRARRRLTSRMWLPRAAVIAGAAAGLGGSWWVAERSLRPPPARIAPTAPPRGRPAPVKPPARVTPPATINKVPAIAPAPVVVNKAPVVTPPPAVVNKAPAVIPPPAVVSKAPAVIPPPAVVNKAPAATPPPVIVNNAPVVTPPPVAVNRAPAMMPPPVTVKRSPVVLPPPPAASRPAAAVAEKPAPVAPPIRSAPAPAPIRPAPPPEVAVPFDAVLGTILYSPDRKLAIVDNRIVGVGDEVRGARVTEITAGAVFLRDAQGKLRRLTLGAGGR
jgi:hypothetical protein